MENIPVLGILLDHNILFESAILSLVLTWYFPDYWRNRKFLYCTMLAVVCLAFGYALNEEWVGGLVWGGIGAAIAVLIFFIVSGNKRFEDREMKARKGGKKKRKA